MVLKYMCETRVCSIIDVDMENKTVKVTNFTNDILMRPFGKNEHPTWEDYEAFLARRCVPKSRDKLKWHLREIGVDHYDPLTIVTKTQGRMAEDNFWIDIEEKEPEFLMNPYIEEKE